MTPPESDDDAVFDLPQGEKVTPEHMFAAVKATRNQLKGVEARLGAAEHHGDKTRNIAYLLIVFTLALGGWFMWDKYDNVADTADSNQQYLMAGCTVGNQDRARQLPFWLGLVADARAEKKNQSPARQKALDAKEAEIRDIYGQRDCSKIRDGAVVKVSPSPPATTGVVSPRP